MSEESPSAASPSKGMAPPSNGFQTASTLLKTFNPSASNGGSTASFRNASGGLPPIPKELPGPQQSESATKGTLQPQPQAGPSKPINRPAASKNSIIYSAVQRRNPVLGAIRNVGIEIGDIVADYQVGTHNGVLFLSLKYHRLHPEYIHQRIEKMKNSYNLRIILVLCDVNEHQQSLRELTKIAIINEFTVFVAWSNEEVAQYLTCFKAFEHKSADTLKERVHQSYHDQLQHALTSGRKVNKTDADNLAAQFGSFATISNQPAKILSNVKGLGAAKVTSLIDAFTKPFLVGGLRREEKEVGDPLIVSQKEQRAVGAPASHPASKGKGRATEAIEHREEVVEDMEANVGSPDWPSDEDDQADQEPVERRGRVPSRSRSPGLSPELGTTDDLPSAEIWQDPLDAEDDDEEEEDGPVTKRPRPNV